ncbi:ribonuclease H-like domain-containing protein [Tanacetum coccineum]
MNEVEQPHFLKNVNMLVARLVANDNTQLSRVDVDETFSLVVKPDTIRTILGLAISRHWPVHQLDVKNAFLHGDLSEIVYMHQPPGFWDSAHPDYVYLLQRSHYGLKQGTDTAYVLLYVDDIVLTASFEILLQRIIATLHHEFSMTDQGSLNYFLGISVMRDSSGMFLSQRKYATETLERANMAGCNSTRTPVDTESKLGDDGDPIFYPTLYPSLADHGFQLFSSSTTSLDCLFGCRLEYRDVANDVAETCWLRNLLHELHTPLSSATLVYCDNVGVVYLSFNPVHFVRDLVTAGQIRVLHVPYRYQYADIFTKGLPSSLFEKFRTSLSVRCPPAPTVREC